MSAGALTEADRRAGWRTLVPTWTVERLDTKLGTAQVVPILKAGSQCVGSVSGCEDGPYPEYARWIERCPRGAHVRVEHLDETIREGYVVWNELANLTTFAALELRYGPLDPNDLMPERSAGRAAREPRPGEQITLFV